MHSSTSSYRSNDRVALSHPVAELDPGLQSTSSRSLERYPLQGGSTKRGAGVRAAEGGSLMWLRIALVLVLATLVTAAIDPTLATCENPRILSSAFPRGSLSYIHTPVVVSC